MKGKLIIAGGGMTASEGKIFREFIDAAGGPESLIAFAVSASGEDPDDTFRVYESTLVSLGLCEGRCRLIPLYGEGIKDERGENFINGDAPQLEGLLDGVSGVWFTGGDQYHTARCFLREDGSDTRLLKELRAMLERGGVIGGSSAGAAIMSSVMIGLGDSEGAVTKPAVHGYGDYEAGADEEEELHPALILARGLGFFPYGIVDQHFDVRPRLLRAIEACLSNREGLRLCFACAEDTAMVVGGETVRALGSGAVYIIDCRQARREGNSYIGARLDLMKEGDEYSAASEKIKRSGAAGPEAEAAMNAARAEFVKYQMKNLDFVKLELRK